jgi:hypothetical protein
MGIVLVLYDCLLTIQDEVYLIPWRLMAVSANLLLADTSCLARTPEFSESLVLH